MGRAAASKTPVQGEAIAWHAHAQLVEQKQEAYLALMDALAGRTGKIPSEYLAAHLPGPIRSCPLS